MTTTMEIIELITAAGLDHHWFKCQAAANRINGIPGNTWEQIAEMARPGCPETQWIRAWELAGVPIPADYLDEDAA